RCCVVLVQVMAQRALADAMEFMAKAMVQEAESRIADRVAQEARRGEEDELRLERFMNNKSPIFKGGYDPDGAQTWLESIE
ncbi:putative Ty3/Gypsy retrotransposon polyprotein, partial [Trifolium medium]|nr:putative Ty3/Gypsy retrotransposon polyprotein [Trifolium medium]